MFTSTKQHRYLARKSRSLQYGAVRSFLPSFQYSTVRYGTFDTGAAASCHLWIQPGECGRHGVDAGDMPDAVCLCFPNPPPADMGVYALVNPCRVLFPPGAGAACCCPSVIGKGRICTVIAFLLYVVESLALPWNLMTHPHALPGSVVNFAHSTGEGDCGMD